MRASLTSNAAEVLGQMARVHPQFQFAAAVALTRTMRAVAAAMPGEIESALDRPSMFTKRGFFSTVARKDALQASVGIKDLQAHYLRWQIQGGRRAPRNVALRLPSVVQLTNEGNLPPGLIRNLIARAKAGKRATSSQQRRFGVSKSLDLFYGEPGDGRPAGIYKRVVLSATRHQLVPIVVFPRRPAVYERRFDFYGVADRKTRSTFERELAQAWDQALRTAR